MTLNRHISLLTIIVTLLGLSSCRKDDNVKIDYDCLEPRFLLKSNSSGTISNLFQLNNGDYLLSVPSTILGSTQVHFYHLNSDLEILDEFDVPQRTKDLIQLPNGECLISQRNYETQEYFATIPQTFDSYTEFTLTNQTHVI